MPTTATNPTDDSSLPAYIRVERRWNILIYGLIAAVILAAIYFDLW